MTSPETLRLFVAVDPAPAAVADLADLVDGLAVGQPQPPGGSLRLTRRDAWHLTLAFLGEVPADRRDAAEAALTSAVARAAGDQGAPVALRIAGGGRFNRGRFTVLWAGVAGDVDRLGALAEAVRRELRRAKLPTDHKPFRPHLTIARPGDRLAPDALAADIASLAAYTGPPWTVTDVHLYASRLGPHPEYTRLLTVNVGPITLRAPKERGLQR